MQVSKFEKIWNFLKMPLIERFTVILTENDTAESLLEGYYGQSL
jgi:hypothetical protein